MILTDSLSAKAGGSDVNAIISITETAHNFLCYIDGFPTIITRAISGGVGIVKNGAGTLTLSAANTITGDTIVNQGTLKIGNSLSLGTSTTLVLNAGTTFDLNGTALQNNAGRAQVVDYSGGGSKIINSGTDISTDNRSLMYTPTTGDIWSQFDDSAGGVISLRLGHQGANVTLQNLNNKIRGKIVLTGGSLTTVYNMASPSFGTGAIEIGNGNANPTLRYMGAVDVDISDRDIYLVSNGGQLGGMYLVNYGTAALTLGDVYAEDNTVSKAFRIGGINTGDNTVSGVIRDATTNGEVRVVKQGNGKWILTGANTYTGSTDIFSGALVSVKGIATATFTPTTLQVAFSTPPTAGWTFKFFPASTTQQYAMVALSGAPGLNGTYDSSNSTLTIS
jgi:fibronectin-binding autotransporter adhesin